MILQLVQACKTGLLHHVVLLVQAGADAMKTDQVHVLLDSCFDANENGKFDLCLLKQRSDTCTSRSKVERC